MSSWRETIVGAFVRDLKPITLVADPDDLLSDSEIQSALSKNGFRITWYEDPIEFRFELEQLRQKLPEEPFELAVIVSDEPQALDRVPFDILDSSRKLEFNLAELFPLASASVLGSVDTALLDRLDFSSAAAQTGALGDRATANFVIESAYGLPVNDISTPNDLFRLLFRVHRSDLVLSKEIWRGAIEALSRNRVLKTYPLDELIGSRSNFIEFIQQSWPQYIQSYGRDVIEGDPDQAALTASCVEKALPPFHDQELRGYVDDWFLAGVLRPAPHPEAASLKATWAAHGVDAGEDEDPEAFLSDLLSTLGSEIPIEDARHTQWAEFALRWADASRVYAQSTSVLSGDAIGEFHEVQAQLDRRFSRWLDAYYSTLANKPFSPPVMVHHAPKAMSRSFERDQESRVALIVVDGLSIDQWLAIRDLMSLPSEEFALTQRAVFAWIPTVTSVSRQAIFAGKPPLFFPKTIGRTDREPALWRQFWEESGVRKEHIGYMKGLGKDDLSGVSELIEDSKVRVLGLVVDTVDKIMHGMVLGNSGMHNQVQQWAEDGYLETLIRKLASEGFEVFITSDHGSTEATGAGSLSEGVLSDVRGERMRVYNSETLRSGAHHLVDSSMEWPTAGLPDDYLPLLATGRSAFVREGESLVCHGGASIEEVLVPYIEIKGRRSE